MIADAYLESEVYSAGPEQLVTIMYDAAIQAIGRARRHLKSGDVEARSREITRAHAILTELGASLNHKAAPKLARDLAELYDYIQRRLIEANTGQDERPLAEASRLLATLLDGWMQLVPMAA
jgi:flagellar protein FliS